MGLFFFRFVFAFVLSSLARSLEYLSAPRNIVIEASVSVDACDARRSSWCGAE